MRRRLTVASQLAELLDRFEAAQDVRGSDDPALREVVALLAGANAASATTVVDVSTVEGKR